MVQCENKAKEKGQFAIMKGLEKEKRLDLPRSWGSRDEVRVGFIINLNFMITVHDTFVCKPGNASKMAKLFKEWANFKKDKNIQVLTDMTGGWHRVTITTEYEDLAAYEKETKEMGNSKEEKEIMDKFSDMNEMYVSGSREIYKVW